MITLDGHGFLLHPKSDVISVRKSSLLMIEKQFGKRVKVLRSDNGSEFFNHSYNDLFISLGIVHKRSCPYTP